MESELEQIKSKLAIFQIVNVKQDFVYKGIGEGGNTALILTLSNGDIVELTLEDYTLIPKAKLK